MAKAKSTAVLQPNLGLYFDRPRIAMDPRMLQAGENFRVQEGRLNNLNLGWERFGDQTLNGAVLKIDLFERRDGTNTLIAITKTDIYEVDSDGMAVTYRNPIYDTGTAAASGTSVTGTGTNWDPEAKAGDQIHFGDADYHDPTGTWFTILSRTNDTTLTLTASAGTVADGAYTIRKTFTGDEQDIWKTATFQNGSATSADEWWATNGVDAPVRWNGSDAEVTSMTSLNFICKTLCVHQNMMIYGNLIQGGTSKPMDILNSDLGDPADVTTGLSEQFRVLATVDEIMDMVPIGDALAIYTEKAVVLAQFVGDPLVFVFRQAVSGTGALSPNAVADFGDYHEFIGNDSQFRFDGATVREIGEHVWRDILRTQDPVRTRIAYHHFDEETGELLWVVPSTVDPDSGDAAGAPSRAFVEHYLEDVPEGFAHPVSHRQFPFTSTGLFVRQDGTTWDTLTQAWEEYNFRWNDQFFFAAFPLNMAGDADGKLYTFGTSQNADGAAMVSFVRFPRRPVVDGRMRGLVTRIYPFATTFSTDMDVTLRLADHSMKAPTITDTQTFDADLVEGGHFTVHYRRGRWMEVEFGADGPSTPWEISGYDYDTRFGGRR